MLLAQSCLTLSDPMDCSLPGSPVHWILQVSIRLWVTFPFPRGFFQSRDRTQVSRIAGGFFTIWATREAFSSLTSSQLLSFHHAALLPTLTQISTAYSLWLFVRILSNCWVIWIDNFWNLIFVWQLTNDFFLNFISFWLHWIFIDACRLSLPAASGSNSLVAVHGLLTAVASLVAENRF